MGLIFIAKVFASTNGLALMSRGRTRMCTIPNLLLPLALPPAAAAAAGAGAGAGAGAAVGAGAGAGAAVGAGARDADADAEAEAEAEAAEVGSAVAAFTPVTRVANESAKLTAKAQV
jgi:hypothetical protein